MGRDIFPAGTTLLHEFVLEDLGIPVKSNYMDVHTLAQSKASEYYASVGVIQQSQKQFMRYYQGVFV